MATVPPQPPQPANPPSPPRSASNIVAIVLLSMGLIVLLCVVAVWAGVRLIERGIKVHVSDGDDSKKEVSISTPFGGLQVNQNRGINEASLGLPIYPGAKALKDEDSASVSLSFGGSNRLRIVAGKFQTADSLPKVRDFYQGRLSSEDGPISQTGRIDPGHDDWDLDSGDMGNFFGLDDDGKMVFKIKRKGEVRVVALKSDGTGTRIELLRVGKGGEKESESSVQSQAVN